jgi:PhzF family phenazine biosynthesis protein
MPIPYYHIDSFANELFAGNPAGICLVPAFPANDVMQKIAAENRHSETAFVVARADGDFDLRWFTPVVEDDLCGHATLASAYALSLRGHDTWPVRFHTVSGLLTVSRDHERFEMDFPSRRAVSCEIPTGLLSALGLEMAEVMRDPRDFLIVVDHAEIVRNLKPDIAALAKIDMGIVEQLLRLPMTMTSIMCAGFSLHPRGSTKMLRPDQSSAHSSHTGPDTLASKHFECSNSVLAVPECGAR